MLPPPTDLVTTLQLGIEPFGHGREPVTQSHGIDDVEDVAIGNRRVEERQVVTHGAAEQLHRLSDDADPPAQCHQVQRVDRAVKLAPLQVGGAQAQVQVRDTGPLARRRQQLTEAVVGPAPLLVQ